MTGPGKLSLADVERVPISHVTIGPRRRQSLGSLVTLKRSIAEHGLFHPILLRGKADLVAGRRRLEACRQLGWTTIPARRVDGLSDDDLRAIELQENTEREALNDYETSKARLAELRQAAADAKREVLPATGKTSKGGRPPKAAASRREVAERTGVARSTQERIEKHVDLAEQYPFMQREGWVQYRVLEAGEKLDALPAKDRAGVAALLDQPAIPPKDAIKIIRHVAEMPAEERREVLTLAKSPDEQDRRVALTKAAALPPPPDPGLLWLLDAARTLRRAAKECRVSGVSPKITDLADQADALIAAMKKG